MSTALFECGFLDDALEYLNKGLELETYNPDYLYNRAYLYKTIEDNEKAITDLKEVLQIDPNHTDARLLLGELEMVNTHE
ncbi:tetratricopeptide repeat protein [Bacillus badius]|uniref:tetratricopeptide repeat protein n=1 Tax=Bacillus badius TaxID=1455 RepID=UPI002E221FD5|nr:tetratricopeptide repeat protein [Bacillus badius]